MRRSHKEHCNDKEKVISAIKCEYEYFKFTMLSNNKRKIYDNCNVIRFYECLYEYFEFNEDIDERFYDVVSQKYINTDYSVIEDIYYLYLKYENLKIGRWNDIDELIEIYENSNIPLNTNIINI